LATISRPRVCFASRVAVRVGNNYFIWAACEVIVVAGVAPAGYCVAAGSAAALRAADFNEDGKLDLAVFDYFNAEVSILTKAL
jgi:hypothetical protein